MRQAWRAEPLGAHRRMSRLWPYFALFGSGLCWGLGLPLGKLALAETGASHMILLRFVVAGIACAPLVLGSSAGRRLMVKPAVLLSGASYAVGFLLQFEGLARSDVAVAALLVGVMPALIAVSAAVMGERVGALAWVGIVAATLGAMLIAGRPGPGVTPLGIGLCLGSLPVFLIWLHAARIAGAGADPVQIAAASIVVAALVLVVLVPLLHGPPRLALSPLAWTGIVGQGLLSTVAATLCWQLGAPRVSTAAAGVFINVEPVIGSGLGVALFHDRLTLLVVLGGLMILAGSLTVVLYERRRPEGVAAAQDAITPA